MYLIKAILYCYAYCKVLYDLKQKKSRAPNYDRKPATVVVNVVYFKEKTELNPVASEAWYMDKFARYCENCFRDKIYHFVQTECDFSNMIHASAQRAHVR